MSAIFETGMLLSTSVISQSQVGNPRFSLFLQRSLNKHINADWGDLEEEDIETNKQALENGDRLFSCYLIPSDININNETKIYIITEADRSATTVLFSSEY